ncbi:indole-3-glycerol phosphate synthase TrpC [Acetohalobium arabaticum]|uniref:Indole-3-glycerol phosphate synthase n=1 Tax=Acetohalobium arabaticum (strain ATCC 49924 / DSM 5501 / Z-7288) TaxID=574087 RepID=D9QS80_ACEAZ|nr:indole-3-glycerol phosphate synthase TrpC [Acetohalobium arabaticum]ADL13371.1 indole-3-glycerol phosphate synthase [Acetohalobium arabaticum DSM 5501]
MFLDKIVANTKEEVKQRKEEISLTELKERLRPVDEVRDFKAALTNSVLGLIAEIKQASPSKGLIRKDFNPVEIAKKYSQNRVEAISILTDEEFFQGSLEYLQQVREATDLPLLRKDFIIDPYQVYEAQAHGADAVLLIVNILTEKKLIELISLIRKLGMEALVEVHTAGELKTACRAGAEIVGINNRNLKTFETDIEQTLQLQELLPADKVIVSESGISSKDDIEKLTDTGVDAVLIGEALMRSDDLSNRIAELLGRSDGNGSN